MTRTSASATLTSVIPVRCHVPLRLQHFDIRVVAKLNSLVRLGRDGTAPEPACPGVGIGVAASPLPRRRPVIRRRRRTHPENAAPRTAHLGRVHPDLRGSRGRGGLRRLPRPAGHYFPNESLGKIPYFPNESLGKIPYFPNEPFGKIPYFQNESFGQNTYFVYYALKVSCSRSSTRTRSLGVGRHPGHGAGPEAPTSSRARALGPVDWDLDRVPSTPSGTEGVSAGRPGCVVGRSPRRHVHRALRARGRQQRRGYPGQE